MLAGKLISRIDVVVSARSEVVSETKFRQIARKIEQRIDQGDYPIHSKLPAHRILADDLNTTPTTIAKAYNLLADKGRVESFVGRGTFVRSAFTAVEDSNTEYDFSLIQPHLAENLPYLQKAMEKMSRELDLPLLSYASQSGHESHRQIGVSWAKHYGLDGGTVSNTVLTSGAQHALSLLLVMLTDVGDTIAVEALAYPGLIAAGQLLKRKLVAVTLDEQGMQPASLRNVVMQHRPKLVVVTPSQQNPTGATMGEARRREIAEIAAQANMWLIEDDVFGFLNPQPIAAIANFIPDRALHLTSLSKAISPSLRCGFLKLPDELVEVFNRHMRANVLSASPVGYAAAKHLLETRDAFRLATQQRHLAAMRHKLACDILGYEVTGHEVIATGYHLWLPLPATWSSAQLVQQAKLRGILLEDGQTFSVANTPSRHVRLALMSIGSQHKFQQGLQILKTLLDAPNVHSLAS